MSNPEFTEFENMVNKEIVLWSQQNPDAIVNCKGKQEVAEAFWASRIAPMYEEEKT